MLAVNTLNNGNAITKIPSSIARMPNKTLFPSAKLSFLLSLLKQALIYYYITKYKYIINLRYIT